VNIRCQAPVIHTVASSMTSGGRAMPQRPAVRWANDDPGGGLVVYLAALVVLRRRS